jgi:hypothetical protein
MEASVYPFILVRQRLREHVSAAMNARIRTVGRGGQGVRPEGSKRQEGQIWARIPLHSEPRTNRQDQFKAALPPPTPCQRHVFVSFVQQPLGSL